jgi:molybdopterin-guanine dinucleotide biosynthesis protein A
MERQIQEKRFQIKKMFRKVRVKKIPETVLRQVDPELMSFFNINTAGDYSKAKRWLEQNSELLT